jgi:FkbH-like protein
MFEFDWSSSATATRLEVATTALPRDNVASTMLVHWQEHCLECAPPQCYATCLLYVARADRKCARLAYGIRRVPGVGLDNHAADLKFRRWGKIETSLRPAGISIGKHRGLAWLDRVVTGFVNVASSLLRPISPFRRLNGALSLYRGKFLERVGSATGADFDDFVIECHLHQEAPARILLEVWNGGTLSFRQSLALQSGVNFLTLPAQPMLQGVDWPHARLTLYPENDAELHLSFTWLDFVKYRPECKPKAASKPASKVKCVAWDLDNTVWEGVLIEDGAEQLRLRQEAVELMRELDERGILQTIVSKNDHEAAWTVITSHGLRDYFLHPQINWDPKSANLQLIAQRLNIHVDTFALIDDSAFERAEVASALPMVRTFPETQISSLLGLPEFDQPITEMSRLRRQSYVVETQREEARGNFSGQYLEFLQSSQMQLSLFVPRTESEITRCHELVQRSNQLNLSSKRYTLSEFNDLLTTEGVLCVGLQCEDKFGVYGTVGFVTVDERAAEPLLTNFVLSCRVAQKHVEHAFFQWLAERSKSAGHHQLLADLVITERNGPLVAVFEELQFRASQSGGSRLTLDLSQWKPSPQVVRLNANLLS